MYPDVRAGVRIQVKKSPVSGAFLCKELLALHRASECWYEDRSHQNIFSAKVWTIPAVGRNVSGQKRKKALVPLFTQLVERFEFGFDLIEVRTVGNRVEHPSIAPISDRPKSPALDTLLSHDKGEAVHLRILDRDPGMKSAGFIHDSRRNKRKQSRNETREAGLMPKQGRVICHRNLQRTLRCLDTTQVITLRQRLFTDRKKRYVMLYCTQ